MHDVAEVLHYTGRRENLDVLARVLAPRDDLRGASVRMASKSKKKPPTTSSDGHESRRWREGAAAPRDAEIIHQASVIYVLLDRRLVADVEEYSRDVIIGEAGVEAEALVEGCG